MRSVPPELLEAWRRRLDKNTSPGSILESSAGYSTGYKHCVAPPSSPPGVQRLDELAGYPATVDSMAVLTPSGVDAEARAARHLLAAAGFLAALTAALGYIACLVRKYTEQSKAADQVGILEEDADEHDSTFVPIA